MHSNWLKWAVSKQLMQCPIYIRASFLRINAPSVTFVLSAFIVKLRTSLYLSMQVNVAYIEFLVQIQLFVALICDVIFMPASFG